MFECGGMQLMGQLSNIVTQVVCLVIKLIQLDDDFLLWCGQFPLKVTDCYGERGDPLIQIVVQFVGNSAALGFLGVNQAARKCANLTMALE